MAQQPIARRARRPEANHPAPLAPPAVLVPAGFKGDKAQQLRGRREQGFGWELLVGGILLKALSQAVGLICSGLQGYCLLAEKEAVQQAGGGAASCWVCLVGELLLALCFEFRVRNKLRDTEAVLGGF